jgi:chromatin modification-related protein YNG2
MDADDDAEDERLYCFCQKQSYGDMVACDNENGCPYEWVCDFVARHCLSVLTILFKFHLSCVGLKQPVPEKWYCDECLKSGAGVQSVRKSRKK